VGTDTLTFTVKDNDGEVASDTMVVTVNETPLLQKTEKNVADGYIVKLNSLAYAHCSNGQTYQSSSNIGDKGLITFENIALTSDCEITIPSSTIIDSNNNGSLDSYDREIGFTMKSFADVSFISPLTTLLLEKIANNEDVTQFKAMVKDFDPVVASSMITTHSGIEKLKIQKLILLMEILKNAMRQSYSVTNIDLSSIVNSTVGEVIGSLDINSLLTGFHNNIFEKTDIMKKLLGLIDDLDSNHLNINSFIVNISDGGKNIEEAINSSLKVPLPSSSNPLEFIVKSTSDVQTISHELSLISSRIDTLKKPTANAGVNQTVAEGRAVTLNGLDSVDFDGTIVSYTWEEAGNILSNSKSFTKNNFSLGEHNITLTVVDDNNNSNSDTMTLIIVANQAPIANAGNNQLAMENETVTLNASQSSDSDGNIVDYKWTESGVVLSTSSSFSKSNFSVGVHTISLIVTDDSGATGYDEVNVTISTTDQTQRNVADGYIIRLYSPAQAICANGNSYQSSLNVWEKGKILFDGISLTGDCNITIAKSTAVIDSNNNGMYDANDKILEFDMQAPADATFISPLTTLLLEKKTRGEDVTELETMVKDFDPVEAATTVTTNIGVEKTKIQKLMVMMEVLKTAMKESASIGDINLSTIVTTASNETIDDLDINALVAGLPSNIQSNVLDKANNIKSLVEILDDINSSKISLNSFLVNISDGGKNITSSLRESVQVGVAIDQNNTIENAVKSSSNTTVVSQLNTINRNLNNIPIAHAGVNQTVTEQSTVTLDGSSSSDIDNEIVTYEWKEGNSLLSNDISFSKNDFAIGEHNITLVVTDALGASAEDNITITIKPNQLPTANAGTDIIMVHNDTITITGQGSDSDGNIVSYEWKKDGATLANIASFSYTATVIGNDILTLIVTDNLGATAKDDLNITVKENIIPVANAGADQNVKEGTDVILSASQSYDMNGSIVKYEWKEGMVVLSNDMNFTKSDFSVGEHNITLTVTDNKGMFSSDNVIITVTNILPTAIVNISDHNVTFGTSINFDASNSYDSHGSIISYEWEQDGTIISNDMNFTKSDFDVGQYTITLTITDNIGDSTSKDYIIDITPVTHEITLCDGKSAYIHIDYNFGMLINDNIAQGKVFDENSSFVGAVLCGEFANPTSSSDVLNILKSSAFSSAINITKHNDTDGSIIAQYEINNANIQAYAQLKSILEASGVTDFNNYIDYSTFSTLNNIYIDLYIKFVDVSTVYIILTISDKSINNVKEINTLIDGQSITDTGSYTIHTDSFTYQNSGSANLKADILFVMDDSGSMSNEQDAAAQAIIDTFGDAMNNNGIDWKATVIGTEEGRNYLNKYISDPSENNITKLASQLRIGAYGGDEVGLKRAYQYLNNGDITVRSGSKLSMVYVSDEVCHTSLSELGVSNINDSYFVQNGIKVNIIIPENLSNNNNLAYQMANLTGGKIANLYNYSTGYNAMMQKVADDAGGTASLIKLTHNPIPATVQLSINGITIASGWSYNATNNSIVFDGTSKPNNSDKVVVTYKY